MIVEEPRTKDQRYRDILAILARHGIGVVQDQVVKDESDREQSRAEHLRQACEELGTVFIKLGQMLSTRGDLLPDTYRAELAKLVDEVPPLPADVIAQVIVEELGASPNELFVFFDPDPIGSASIGQVHCAELPDRRVVVKVRKPGVETLVQTDLEILADLVKAWSPRFPILEQFDALSLVREFSDTLRAELDYRREAANEKLFHEAFCDDAGYNIPDVIDELSTERVLTHERVDGVKPEDIVATPLEARKSIAQRIARFVLEPPFKSGVFYADPHAGNLLIQEDGTLAVIDFGMVGRLTPETRRRIADMFVAIRRRDSGRLADRIIEVTSPSHPIDRTQITNDVDRLLQQYVDVSFESIRVESALSELLQLLRHYRLRLPGNIAQFFKALAMGEGIVLTLDPESTLSDYLQPLVSKLLYGGIGGPAFADRMRDSAVDAAELSIELPRRIDRVLGEVERGNLRVWTRIEDVETLVKRLERMVERANATMLAAACIVGLAILLQIYHPQGWQQWVGVVFWIAVVASVIGAMRTLFGLRK